LAKQVVKLWVDYGDFFLIMLLLMLKAIE